MPRGGTVALRQPAPHGSSHVHSPVEEAIASTRSILGNVTADQLDDPTPCASWKVRDVINHVVGAQHYFVGALHRLDPS